KTIKDIAIALDGLQYGDKVPNDIIAVAKNMNAIICHGSSDDLLSVWGAFDDEFDAYDGTVKTIQVQGTSVDVCAVWVPNGGPYVMEEDKRLSWKVFPVGDIHFASFMIWEDDEPFCRGAVISMDSPKFKVPEGDEACDFDTVFPVTQECIKWWTGKSSDADRLRLRDALSECFHNFVLNESAAGQEASNG
ncbi:MAG: hypothetical protein AAGF75_08885, partial [Cyanobacteria bacterium P01_H01_bin.130]